MMIDRRALLNGLCAAALMPAASMLGAAAPRPTRELMVPVRGGRICVRVNGDLKASRPPLLMIHGGPGGSHAGFLPALELARDRAVILYDQLDSGKSDAPNNPANWTVPRFVDEIDAIRTALGVARLHVLGASWGGTIALEYAARRPRGLASTILQGPLVSTRSWLADANVLRAQLDPATRATLADCDAPPAPPAPVCTAATGVFYKAFNRRVPASAEVAAYTKTIANAFNERIYNGMWGASEFVSTGTLKTYDGEPLLSRRDGPRTLFVVGQYDEARPATVADFATRVPGSAFAVIEDAAHGILNDNPEAYLATLSRWLRRRDPA